MAVNKIKSNSSQNMQIQWLRSVHAEITVEIAPHQQSKDEGQSGSSRSGARTLGSTRGLARGSSQHQNGVVLSRYIKAKILFFLHFWFSPSLSYSQTLSLSLFLVIAGGLLPPSPLPSPPSLVGIRGNKGHRSTDQNLLVPNLAFLSPKYSSFPTNLKQKIRENFFYLVFFFFFVFGCLCFLFGCVYFLLCLWGYDRGSRVFFCFCFGVWEGLDNGFFLERVLFCVKEWTAEVRFRVSVAVRKSRVRVDRPGVFFSCNENSGFCV